MTKPPTDTTRAGPHPGRDPRGPRAAPSKPQVRPSWRDPWFWLSALAVVPLLLLVWGAPLGEPVADDYHFLHRALLERGTPWDGGGAVVYWRPLARQGYYGLLGPLMLDSPRTIALFHATLLALATLLLYRVLRRHWSGPWAAAAATFPLLAESSRVLLLWPSTIQDLGALAFSALALHERAHGRRWTALPALLAALLCKEIAVVTALLLPWVPTTSPPGRDDRRGWMLAVAAVLALWGGAYLLVVHNSYVIFQRHLESGAPSLPRRLAWALANGLDDAFSLRALPPSLALWLGAAAAIILATAAGLALRFRGRLAGAGGWVAWGVVWFAASTATLSEVWPVWGPFRSVVPMVGLGVACVGLTRAAGQPALAALVALRLLALALAPAPSERIEAIPPAPEAALELSSLVRLQRLAAQTRIALGSAYPALPPGARVVEAHRPLMAEHAFADGKALRVWYRDSTLAWTTWNEFLAAPGLDLAAAVEYEPRALRQIALVTPEAAREYARARRLLAAEDYVAALSSLARADSLQRDRGAAIFLGTIAGRRSVALLGEGDTTAARRAAERSLALWPEGNDSRYTLAVLLVLQGRGPEARAQLDTLLSHHPFDASAREMRDSIIRP